MHKSSVVGEGPVGDYEVVRLVQKAEEGNRLIRRAMYAEEGGDVRFAGSMYEIASVFLQRLAEATKKPKLVLIDEAVEVLLSKSLSADEIDELRRDLDDDR